MFARAAATASVPMISGTVYLDMYDSKIIQYNASLIKLKEMKKILGVLNNSLEKNTDMNIIPLMNYILLLCEGPIFNVHPTLRKRYMLLSEFKLCKTTEIIPPLSTSNINFLVEYPDVIEDIESFKENLYNKELQWKLLKSLNIIVANSITIYSKKMKQIQLERSANRTPDAFGRAVQFNTTAVDDLLQPVETTMCLDLAVLLKNKEQDTNDKSFYKLQVQVLSKFVTCLQEKILPVINPYYQTLKKYSVNRGATHNLLKDLPHWEYSMHRIFALLFRTLNIMEVMIAMTRQLYLPNKIFLNSTRTKLCSENVNDYKILLTKLEVICSNSEDNIKGDLIKSLEYYSRIGAIFPVQQNNIMDSFQMSVSKILPIARHTFETLKCWLEMWQIIQNNNAAATKLASVSDEQLQNMLNERIEVDKLASIEKMEKKMEENHRVRQEKLKNTLKLYIDEGNKSNPSITIKRTLSRRTGGSSGCSSLVSSPGKESPFLSRTPSRSVSSSGLTSPSISRNGSVSARGNKTMSNRLSGWNEKKTGGRKRSSSLQSSFHSNQTGNSISPLPSRANSLQVGSALNQKMLQDTVNHLMGTRMAIHVPSPMPNSKITVLSAKPKSKINSPVNISKPSGKALIESSNQTIKKKDKDIMLKKDSNIKEGSKKDKDVMSKKETVVKDIPKMEKKKPVEMKASNTNAAILFSKNGFDEIDLVELQSNYDEVKRVRFINVPPMTEAENPKPKRKGWYKKPEVLHYPSPPTSVAGLRSNIRQEGMAYRLSLREVDPESSFRSEIEQPKKSTRSRLKSKLLDKLR